MADLDFQCFAPPNNVPEGGACDQAAGPYCQHGLTCLAGTSCKRFCCTNADCGVGTCQFFGTYGALNVNICM